MATAKAPRYRQSFFVGKNYLGASMRQPKQVHEEKHAPASVSYFCPVCGTVWAVCPVEDTLTNTTSDYMPYRIPCEAHDTRPYAIPGSLWLNWDEQFNATLPDEVIKYELKQALKLYEE